MGFRSTLTSLLLVILTFASNIDSTCAVSCELSTIRSAAHAAEATHAQPDHCGHIATTQQTPDLAPPCVVPRCNPDHVAALSSTPTQSQPVPLLIAASSPVVGFGTRPSLKRAGTSASTPHAPPRLTAVLRL